MTPGLNLVISAHPGTLFGQVHITFLPLEPGWTIHPHSKHVDRESGEGRMVLQGQRTMILPGGLGAGLVKGTVTHTPTWKPLKAMGT